MVSKSPGLDLGGERYSFEAAAQESGCRLVFTHVGYLSEEEAHEPWKEVHERYAERFGVDPGPGRRFLAAQRAGQ